MSTLSLPIAAPLKHNRLTTFFRYFLAIPLLIVNYVYAIIAYIAVVIAWFAIVITGRYPAGLYGIAAGYLRFSTCVVAYMMLAVDAYPPSAATRRSTTRCGSTSLSARSATAGSRRCSG